MPNTLLSRHLAGHGASCKAALNGIYSTSAPRNYLNMSAEWKWCKARSFLVTSSKEQSESRKHEGAAASHRAHPLPPGHFAYQLFADSLIMKNRNRKDSFPNTSMGQRGQRVPFLQRKPTTGSVLRVALQRSTQQVFALFVNVDI